ncbi:hypothetical protein PYCCODRAFT_1433383 [Trametes coccinea BRFM310]|uniref:Uncharacterized protein n=1 Tax=Trametes coccinea (strain BRFM310) TaxID=1353009 RepID=A0A1Y2IV75_TRAC3|nr:hypothetical protein PYCCODRAFT_1433383 [Trametes coccinea BRFM310]
MTFARLLDATEGLAKRILGASVSFTGRRPLASCFVLAVFWSSCPSKTPLRSKPQFCDVQTRVFPIPTPAVRRSTEA